MSGHYLSGVAPHQIRLLPLAIMPLRKKLVSLLCQECIWHALQNLLNHTGNSRIISARLQVIFFWLGNYVSIGFVKTELDRFTAKELLTLDSCRLRKHDLTNFSHLVSRLLGTADSSKSDSMLKRKHFANAEIIPVN